MRYLICRWTRFDQRAATAFQVHFRMVDNNESAHWKGIDELNDILRAVNQALLPECMAEMRSPRKERCVRCGFGSVEFASPK